jgi:cation diffusion facilitator family transporter
VSAHGGKKAIIAAFFANLGIAIAKLIGFAITGAASMLAESFHSLADTGNQGLLLLGQKRAGRSATTKHPFGYARERYFWAFVVALVLFSLGGVFALYEGIHKLSNPHQIENANVAFVILGIAILLESFSLRTAVVESRPSKGSRSWWRFIQDTKAPELPTVLLEDIGAELGLIFAVAGLAAAEITGDPRYDAIGSIAIGTLLVAIAIVLAVKMKSLLTGEAADPSVDAAIRQAVLDGPEVTEIVHLRTLHLGPEELLVGIKVVFASDLGLDVAKATNVVEARIRDRVAEARYLFVESGLTTQVNP